MWQPYGYKLMFKNVKHIPDLKINLMSTGVLDDEDFNSHFAQGVWKLAKSSFIVAIGRSIIVFIRVY